MNIRRLIHLKQRQQICLSNFVVITNNEGLMKRTNFSKRVEAETMVVECDGANLLSWKARVGEIPDASDQNR